MATAFDTYFRDQLVERRRRLRVAAAEGFESARLSHLLAEVDQALSRLEAGTFGVCETCHESIETDRLLADPLLRFCIDHLSEPEQRALEEDLELAARIQRGFLPPPKSVFGLWTAVVHSEPAGPVSGDYCDLFAPPDANGEVYFTFGDVSGKGVAAALLMSHLRAIFRTLVGDRRRVDELVRGANGLFRESTLAPFFATLVCGRALPDGSVEMTNAGHCPPLVVRASGVEQLGTTGLPLGVFLARDFTSLRVPLQPGDTLVLYTDGLSEARDRSGAEYGTDRLAALLGDDRDRTPEGIVSALLGDLSAFLGGAPRHDDLTLMTLQRRT
jgi:sigma-B regulation protein RsbU (phosphoserine phosphatase)